MMATVRGADRATKYFEAQRQAFLSITVSRSLGKVVIIPISFVNPN